MKPERKPRQIMLSDQEIEAFKELARCLAGEENISLGVRLAVKELVKPHLHILKRKVVNES